MNQTQGREMTSKIRTSDLTTLITGASSGIGLELATPFDVVVAGSNNQLPMLSFQLMSPFLSLTPPAMLMSIGRLFMGGSSSGRHQVQHIS